MIALFVEVPSAMTFHTYNICCPVHGSHMIACIMLLSFPSLGLSIGQFFFSKLLQTDLEYLQNQTALVYVILHHNTTQASM
jgi:hypothetical protein